MIYNNIITKEYIDENIRPFSANDALYASTVREAIQLDLTKLDNTVSTLLLNDLEGASDEDRDRVIALLEDNLKMAIAYFAYSRAIRTSQVTVTKYGATVKNSQDSYTADTDKVVADSTYYKNTGEKYLELFFKKHPDLKDSDSPVRDQYIKCKVIGD